MNYRDSLAAASPSSSSLPGRILGNEGVGVVEQSHNPAFSAGDVVFANGAGLGSERDGTLASHALVPEASLIPLPEGLEPASAAILGAAGMVAMLSLQAMERANA
ncbi:MAG: oxidoreductase, partial [Aestuariivirgaceae bacterium]|nr:oxidoreductase [Aestuariivirgaceae bacterium]